MFSQIFTQKQGFFSINSEQKHKIQAEDGLAFIPLGIVPVALP
jgi:hypothetical protein